MRSRCNYSCELPSCSRFPSASGSLVDIYASFRSNRRRSRASDSLRNASVVTLEKWGRIFAITVIGNEDSFNIKFKYVWSKLQQLLVTIYSPTSCTYYSCLYPLFIWLSLTEELSLVLVTLGLLYIIYLYEWITQSL